MDREGVGITTEIPGGSDESRNPRYIVILAIASGLILSIGWLLKPGEDVPESVAVGAQVDSRLTNLTQRRLLVDTAEYFGEVALDFAPGVARLRSVRRSAVVWETERVITARVAWRYPAAVTLAAVEGDVGAYTNMASPHLPIAAMRIPRLSRPLPPPRRPVSEVESGEWVLAVWQTDTGPAHAPATYLGTSGRPCGDVQVSELVTNMPLRPTMLGGGVFDLDGNLLGMVLRCDGQDAVVTVESVTELLAWGDTHDGRLRGRWGLHVESLTPVEAFHFGVGNGLMVRQIWQRYPGQATGLRTGDILLALDGTPLRNIEDLQILEGDEAPSQETFWLELRRGPETLIIAMPARGIDARLDRPVPATAGLVWEEPTEGFRIASVLPGSRAAEAGIMSGDRLVRVDHRDLVSLDEVQQVLTDDRMAPTFVEFVRAGRYRGVLLP